MEASDYIALFALLISAFTFYYTSLRKNNSLFLVRVESSSTYIYPDFAIINGGDTDVLITSVLCVFYMPDNKGWESPDDQQFVSGDRSTSIHAGKSQHYRVSFPGKFSESLITGGTYKKNGTFELYHRDMGIIVDWVDSRGKEYKAEAKIINYGIDINGEIRSSSPLIKWHDLYKMASNKLST